MFFGEMFIKNMAIDKKKIKNILKNFGIKQEYVEKVLKIPIEEHPTRNYYGYDDFHIGRKDVYVDPKNKKIFLTKDASNETILEESLHALHLTGNLPKNFTAKQFLEDWKQAEKKEPRLSIWTEELKKDREKNKYDKSKAGIFLEQLAHTAKNLKIDKEVVPQSIKRYGEEYFNIQKQSKNKLDKIAVKVAKSFFKKK